MLNRIIELSIRHRAFVIVAGLALAVWGVFAVYHTPIDAVPDLSENQVIVFTDWPGHSPQEIEDQITYPLSRNLQSLAGIRVVRGSSDVNYSMLHLIFVDAVDFTTARTRVQERLTMLADSLPSGVVPRLAPDAIPTGQIFWYTLEGAGYDLARLRAVQDWYVKHQLESVPGVAEVASVGGQIQEYHVNLDPLRLRDRGVEVRDVLVELARSNAAVGGDVIHKANAEFIVRGVGWLGAEGRGARGEGRGVRDEVVEASAGDTHTVLRDLRRLLIPVREGVVPLEDVARVTLGVRPRRGILEKDGNEVTGGVVLMRYGQNPLEVIRRLREKLQELQVGLPAGVRIIPCYDRTGLIEGAVATVAGTLVEAIVTATICVVLILMHLRTSFIIAVTLPLSALSAFVMMWVLRRLGIADIQTNIMSLAGIAISIGVLVDSSIVMAENAMFHLRERFGDEPVRGDIRAIVLPACQTVGRPIFFSVLIMLISFLPVFALGGIDGKMYRPLAFTKSFALASVAVLAVTLVPALCTIFIKGRLRRETDSWIVRSVIEVYRPVLNYLLEQPGVLVWILGATLILGTLPLGNQSIFLLALFASLIVVGLTLRTTAGRIAGVALLIVTALIGDQFMKPLATELRMPLDEGMVMDMPITIPRASSVQSGDDLKARDMLLCRFPEVEMVVGKAGRAESPFDPAPLDMIETMVMFRPHEFWPRRKLPAAQAQKFAQAELNALISAKLIAEPSDPAAAKALLDEALMAAMPRFDTALREFAYQRNQEFTRALRGVLLQFLVEQTSTWLREGGALTRAASPAEIAGVAGSVATHASAHLAMSPSPDDVKLIARHAFEKFQELEIQSEMTDPFAVAPGWLGPAQATVDGWLGRTPATFFSALQEAARERSRELWTDHLGKLDGELLDRAPATFVRAFGEEVLYRALLLDERLVTILDQVNQARRGLPAAEKIEAPGRPARAPKPTGHHSPATHGPLPLIDPHPVLDRLYADLTAQFAKRVVLWPLDREELAGSYGGELDRVMQMPGWTNVWTMPIQNRVDMLATGVNTEIGVRVLGRRIDDVVSASEEIAALLKQLPGAADVIADPVRGKGYLEIRPDRERAARQKVSVGDVLDVVQAALGGAIGTTTVEGRERHAVRVRYEPEASRDEEAIARLPVPVRGGGAAGRPAYVPLESVASIRLVEGPATIKSENGLLRNYVRMNVRGRGTLPFIDEARRAVAEQVELPEGTYLEWTGQFEHAQATARTLTLVVPLVIGLIFLILWLTYFDFADACLMLLAIPGAVAGGLLFQWLFGYRFSVAVGVGYIACFGMAASTGMIMLVYLREAVDRAGGLSHMTLEQLRAAVIDGAVHRLRPKLLTEATTILGLAPMLWATGVGAEVIRPMAAPVLGGILIADEVIDLLLPILFYHVRRRRWQRLQSPGGEGPI
ncbi:MAG: efflux RND transporter permease subunit [Planctomycetaceae bacterium]|nr:efflux RND transporter permease subunit [Planctomycetaceae bacterium]